MVSPVFPASKYQRTNASRFTPNTNCHDVFNNHKKLINDFDFVDDNG